MNGRLYPNPIPYNPGSVTPPITWAITYVNDKERSSAFFCLKAAPKHIPPTEKLAATTAAPTRDSLPFVETTIINVEINNQCIPEITKNSHKPPIKAIAKIVKIPPKSPNDKIPSQIYWPINAPNGPKTHNAIGNITTIVKNGANTIFNAAGITLLKNFST